MKRPLLQLIWFLQILYVLKNLVWTRQMDKMQLLILCVFSLDFYLLLNRKISFFAKIGWIFFLHLILFILGFILLIYHRTISFISVSYSDGVWKAHSFVFYLIFTIFLIILLIILLIIFCFLLSKCNLRDRACIWPFPAYKFALVQPELTSSLFELLWNHDIRQQTQKAQSPHSNKKNGFRIVPGPERQKVQS